METHTAKTKQLLRCFSSCQYISGPNCSQSHGLDSIMQKRNLKHYFSMHIQIFADRLRTGNNSTSEFSGRYGGKKEKNKVLSMKKCRLGKESWQPCNFCFALPSADRHLLCIPGRAGLLQQPSAGKEPPLQTLAQGCTVPLGALGRVIGREEFKDIKNQVKVSLYPSSSVGTWEFKLKVHIPYQIQVQAPLS